MAGSESEILTARLASMKALLDALEHACSESAEQQKVFAKLRAELKAATASVTPRGSKRAR